MDRETVLDLIDQVPPVDHDEWIRRVDPVWKRMKRPPERPMYLIAGRRGAGKTLLACEIGQARMKRGERVYSNFPIETVERSGSGWRVTGRSGVVHSLMQCLDLRDCTVIIDEANLWTSAREWSKIPSAVLSSWQQSRKHGISFIFTTQHEERVDKIVRELCDWILLCERPALVPKWIPLFRVQWTYLEEINEVRRGRVSRPEYRVVPSSVFAGYDTKHVLDPEQLQKIAAYAKAVSRGEDPDELAVGLPDRTDPFRVSPEGLLLPWDPCLSVVAPDDLSRDTPNSESSSRDPE